MTPDRSARWVMRAGTPARAELTLIDHGGRVALLKSYDHTPWLFRWTIGRRLTRREAAAYRALAGIRGVPGLLERRGSTALVVELVDGRSCFACRPNEFDAAFFDRLTELLGHLRARGVLHGDIKRNVIRGQDGHPWLVDFGASFGWLRYLPWLRSPLMELAARYDRRAVAKLKVIVAPHLLSDADRRHIDTPLPFQALVRSGEMILRQARQRLTGPRAQR